MTMSVQYWKSPIGVLQIRADQRKLRSIVLTEAAEESHPNPITEKAICELEEYFSGKRKSFSVAALPHGTPFQLAVWNALARIPYGTVVTYVIFVLCLYFLALGMDNPFLYYKF